MRRQLALAAEVVGRDDEPAAERLGPVAIGDDAGGQRMIGPERLFEDRACALVEGPGVVRAAERAMDRVRTRFGRDAVIRGKLYGRGKSRPSDVDIEEGKTK